ncbi:MAG: NAD-dependent epimerase/dehydratase family protein [Alphaproteobacteria bacterium]|nr:NAD-dependent epimerase/dehydratase family protein [Alphaproteobacteria bacterium]
MALSDGPVLVIGAAGCIGAQVVANLVRDGGTPVVFDIAEDRRRLHLMMDGAAADAVAWVTGDIREPDLLKDVMSDHNIAAIVHLAALQVPFCNADPVMGAQVNVVGQVNVFEAARSLGIKGLAYASSVAALPPGDEKWPSTLYGAFKMADEAIADVYWRTWQVPSIGIRPHTVYGPGRDQGVTAAPTKAMLAAAGGQRFTVPFDGPIMLQHTVEVADAFIRTARAGVDGVHVCDLCGADTTIAEVIAAISQVAPEAQMRIDGDPLPFVSGLDDSALRALVGDWPRIGLATGVAQSIASFKDLLARGLLENADAYRDPLGKGHHEPYDA